MLTKVAAKNMRYLARIKFSRSLDHKKMFGLIWQVVFKLETYFFKWVGYIFWVWMNSAKSHERQLFFVILETNHNQTLIWLWLLGNVVHWSKFKARSRDTLFSWTFDLYIYFKGNNQANICLFNMNFLRKSLMATKTNSKPCQKSEMELRKLLPATGRLQNFAKHLWWSFCFSIDYD